MAIRRIRIGAAAAVFAGLALQPAQARFLQTDPAGYQDDLDDYLYTHDDPNDGTDPSGMVELDMISGPAMAESDPEIVRAASVFTLGPKYFTILAHGDQHGLVDLRTGTYVTRASAMYKLMLAGGYKAGQVPVFLSCNLAGSALPKDLANLTHTPVYAAQGYSDVSEIDRLGTSKSTVHSVEFESFANRNGEGERKSYHAFSPTGSHMPSPDISSMVVNTEAGTATVSFDAPTGTRIKPPSQTICVDPKRCGGK
jgi:hypothetical protein